MSALKGFEVISFTKRVVRPNKGHFMKRKNAEKYVLRNITFKKRPCNEQDKPCFYVFFFTENTFKKDAT